MQPQSLMLTVGIKLVAFVDAKVLFEPANGIDRKIVNLVDYSISTSLARHASLSPDVLWC